MRDFKSQKPVKVKANRRKRQKEPRDWSKFFQRALGIGVLIGKLALVVLLLGGAGLAARQIFHSGYFGVAKVRVENLGRVSEEEVVALSDIRPGMNIFDLELEMIGRKIEENPWIATARVERVLPREVVISVRERVPKALINLGYLYYLDAGGVIFKVLGPEDSIDYPVVTGIDRRTLLENPGDCRKQLEEAVLLLDELAGRRIFSLDDVSELNIDPTDGLTLYTFSGGIPVRMGYSNFSSKLDRLERIYPELEPRLPALKYIDLNVADRVIVKVDSRRTIGNG
jgi:cell division protein FtsQ